MRNFKSFVLLFLLCLGLSGESAASGTKKIYFTHASTGQLVWTDSMLHVDCHSDSGPPIFFLETTYLYRYTPGLRWIRIDSLYADGKEGLPDSFEVTVSGSYYVADRNNVGEACPPESGPIYVQVDSVVTHVAIDERLDPIVSRKVFNIRGQMVSGHLASGIYYEKRWHRSKRVSIFTFRVVR